MTDQAYEKLSEKIQVCVSKEHRFGTDAFLLASFAAPRRKDLVCDLGTGCGIIPLILSCNALPKRIYGVDIQPMAIEQFRLGLAASEIENEVVPVCADLTDLKSQWKEAPFGMLDVVTCNPPYKAANAGIQSELEAQRIARHEILCNIYDVCKAGASLLKFGGRLCICNRPERLCDVVSAMKQNDIEPKTLRFVSKTPNDAPWLFLIEGKKGSKPFLKVLPTLYIQGKDGFSEELLSIYNHE